MNTFQQKRMLQIIYTNSIILVGKVTKIQFVIMCVWCARGVVSVNILHTIMLLVEEMATTKKIERNRLTHHCRALGKYTYKYVCTG